jgi:cytochrome b561
MPLSGWIFSTASGHTPNFWWSVHFNMPGIPTDQKSLSNLAHAIHGWFNLILIGLITLHVLAAIKHHWIDKDNVLKQILPKTLRKN